MTTDHGGLRPTAAVLAALLTALTIAACGRQEGPAATPAGSAPAAAPAASVAAEPMPDSTDPLEHGRYLVETIAACGNCHTPKRPDGTSDMTRNFAGAYVIDGAAFKAYAPNITPDMETGIGSWTEDQIVEAIRNARRPDGRYLGPPMAFAWYRHLSDTDVRAIARYVKSVPAVRNEVPASTYKIPLNGYGPDVTSVPDVPKTDRVKYGEYLAGAVGHCMDCHTPLVMGQNDLKRIGLGGNVFVLPEWTAVSANLTSHPDVGLGAWTDDEIKRAITDGVSRNGRKLFPLMAFERYKRMQPGDLEALVAYLRTVPPLAAQ